MNKIPKTKIAKLPTIENVSKLDKILLSKMEQSEEETSVLSSECINFSSFCVNLLDYLERMEDFYPKCDFFAEAKNAIINVSICEKSSSVPNINYTIELIKIVEELEKRIYDAESTENGYIPSHIGQVVMGENGLNETKLRKIYGQNTRWIQIKGRFLFGTGSPGSENTNRKYGLLGDNVSLNVTNKKMGGQTKASIETLEKHEHSFNNATFRHFPEKEVEFNVYCDQTFETYDKYTEWSGRYGRMKKSGWEVVGDVALGGAYAIGTAIGGVIGGLTGGHHRSTTHLTSNAKKNVFLGGALESKNFSFKAEGDIEENDSEELPHDNMPPYYVVSIWERIE